MSGGEPLAQATAVAELLAMAGEQGIDRCIETAGAVSWTAFERVIDRVDRWLFDCKSVDPARFRAQTTGDVTQPLANLTRVLAETATPVQVRIPLDSWIQ